MSSSRLIGLCRCLLLPKRYQAAVQIVHVETAAQQNAILEKGGYIVPAAHMQVDDDVMEYITLICLFGTPPKTGHAE